MRRLAYFIALLGLVLVVKSSYVFGKAQLAQWLLWRAWQENKDELTANHKAWYYADGYPVGQLNSLTHNISHIVMNDASNRNMAFAPGIWHHSSNNTIIAAHNDTHFAFVKALNAGDELSYVSQGRVEQHFRVVAIVEKEYRDTDWMYGLDNYLILITCQSRSQLDVVPTGRLVVLAEPINSAVLTEFG
jgi:sortase A